MFGSIAIYCKDNYLIFMQYEEWIKREKRFRLTILRKSKIIRESKIYRVCGNCDEVLLCHENECPNCGSKYIKQQKLDDSENNNIILERIRCRYRFENIYKDKKTNEKPD